jgi:hypothetical protein
MIAVRARHSLFVGRRQRRTAWSRLLIDSNGVKSADRIRRNEVHRTTLAEQLNGFGERGGSSRRFAQKEIATFEQSCERRPESA